MRLAHTKKTASQPGQTTRARTQRAGARGGEDAAPARWATLSAHGISALWAQMGIPLICELLGWTGASPAPALLLDGGKMGNHCGHTHPLKIDPPPTMAPGTVERENPRHAIPADRVANRGRHQLRGSRPRHQRADLGSSSTDRSDDGRGGRASGLVDDLAVARDAGAGDHLVVEVQRQLTLAGDHQP